MTADGEGEEKLQEEPQDSEWLVTREGTDLLLVPSRWGWDKKLVDDPRSRDLRTDFLTWLVGPSI